MQLFLPVVLGMLLVLPAPAFADRDDEKDATGAAALSGSATGQRNGSAAADISDGRAASLVRQQYGDARILGVSRLDESGGSPVYRVRTLTEDGVVKSVFVDGSSGEVFE